MSDQVQMTEMNYDSDRPAAENPVKIMDLSLRDGHQSLFATRGRTEDMIPVAEMIDEVGFWAVETWGGATFDSCIRYLGEDPWERLRQLKAAMPNTKQQMLFRAQNILGYRHYADDVVRRFVDTATENGMDVYRIFDAMNDLRNLKSAIAATLKIGKQDANADFVVSDGGSDWRTWRVLEIGSGRVLEDELNRLTDLVDSEMGIPLLEPAPAGEPPRPAREEKR